MAPLSLAVPETLKIDYHHQSARGRGTFEDLRYGMCGHLPYHQLQSGISCKHHQLFKIRYHDVKNPWMKAWKGIFLRANSLPIATQWYSLTLVNSSIRVQHIHQVMCETNENLLPLSCRSSFLSQSPPNPGGEIPLKLNEPCLIRLISLLSDK